MMKVIYIRRWSLAGSIAFCWSATTKRDVIQSCQHSHPLEWCLFLLVRTLSNHCIYNFTNCHVVGPNYTNTQYLFNSPRRGHFRGEEHVHMSCYFDLLVLIVTVLTSLQKWLFGSLITTDMAVILISPTHDCGIYWTWNLSPGIVVVIHTANRPPRSVLGETLGTVFFHMALKTEGYRLS